MPGVVEFIDLLTERSRDAKCLLRSTVSTTSLSDESFLGRYQFLLYRLFSLAGLIPVGAFLVVHLLTNSSVLAGAASFQARVDLIHSLGPLLPTIEWLFIFLPMLFHAVMGFVIIATGVPNVGSYSYMGNVRYTLQRVSAMIAFAFIFWHIAQLHWMGAPLGGGQFDPHHAASSAAVALKPVAITLLYATGIIATVYHFANGLWSIGITWGLWTSPAAMQRANWLSIIVGVGLGAAGLGALGGMRSIDVEKAKEVETRMYKARQLLEGGISVEDTQQSTPAVSVSRVSSDETVKQDMLSKNKE